MTTRIFSRQRLVLALVLAGVIGATGAGVYRSSHAAATASVTAAATVPAAPGVSMLLPDFTQISARNGPAVVNISVSGMAKVPDGAGDDTSAQLPDIPGLDPNDPFYQFFRRFQGPNAGPSAPRERPVRAQGSGFIINADGLILTNAHVVRDAKEVVVKLTDRREFEAKVLGSDPSTDVAVLKIDARDLPTVKFGSARDLQVGEWVLAIGSPFGFENSVSAGVVSAKGRSLPDDGFVPFLQTDVAVNPGNSGGPLFNARGEVVGINSQIYSRTGGYQGLSFAIPIEVATRVKDQIVATGKASHARLGVAVQEVNQTLAESFKLDKPEGALVTSVAPGGPAERAGLKPGDVIRKMDGKPVVASGDLPAMIGQALPGQQVKFEVWRSGRVEQLEAKLADAADKEAKVASADPAGDKGKLGLALRPMQPRERRDAGVEGGLLIEDVVGAAARAGIEAGDVLLAVDGTPVSSLEQVRAVVAKSGKSVALLIHRDGERIFVPVRIG
ncbi:MAG: peptidase [Betaproteobacteria bacterium HGW-Betaproteobacteria-3]|jgi:serine protease Do|nr:MAG: peptidase [Betaproteobacteria bacterium HGW-Betaproteobacteria-3]